MVRFMSLSSGSCGNCYFLGTETDGILIDAGISLRKLKKGLEGAGLSFDSFSSILVTHNHLDHVRHLGPYCKKLGKPVYTSELLHKVFTQHSFTRDYFPGCGRILDKGRWNNVSNCRVMYFVVPHDASQTVGYAIEIEGHKFVIMTDLGKMVDEALSFARQADTIVVESNYDVDMLIRGNYTYDLKMRIMGGSGHLSNDQCAEAIVQMLHPGLRNIFLCHLSENNNTPDLAYRCSAAALDAVFGASDAPSNQKSAVASPELQSAAGNLKRPMLRCLPRTYPSPLFIL